MRYFPSLPATVHLMRLHQPAGIWLLLWPCWWALALASDGFPPPLLLALFALGAICMRAAGCIINDMTDRNIDRQVARTRTRPLASGVATMRQASGLLALLLTISLAIALTLGEKVLLYSALALVPVVIYPWMKRITWWPQLFLGLTFNLGALIGWVALRGAIEWPAIWLYLGGICWTLGYDTIYAHQDREDDALIGVKSTARLFGARTPYYIGLFYALALCCWVIAGNLMTVTPLFYALCALLLVDFIWQIYALELKNPTQCLKIFKHNRWLGLALFFIYIIA